ncbi:hypothetical protein SK128_025783, partial [Halocaridina rubra]
KYEEAIEGIYPDVCIGSRRVIIPERNCQGNSQYRRVLLQDQEISLDKELINR